ncbi:hypothetical protein SAMN04487866_12822 [Thermoactinomyces sp. DSM 45891]|uniref:hypothetical protein n=1 Tax=Thermoactinomyces sp. DSM 45891 TaxID=1761907 RepID=UPI0009195E78|nr:hypothetical protein [Thermoactinomyces sp. DSM 45891]SFX81041.1 hypothetical protein SAMN04487866_12822 [Thermoactinomyces sp. DSM 45891]
MPVSVIMNQIIVNKVDANGAVATGQNDLSEWSVQGKSNIPNGIQTGIFLSTQPMNFQIDNDLIDTVITQPEIGNPEPRVQI